MPPRTLSAQLFVSTSSRVVVPWQQRRPLPLASLPYSHFQYYKKIVKMKLAIASLLVGSAAAFAPAATPIRSSALNMATETATEKVRYKICKSIERIFGFRCLSTCLRGMQRVSWVKQYCTLHLGYFVCSYLRLCSVTFRAVSNAKIISYAMHYAL